MDFNKNKYTSFTLFFMGNKPDYLCSSYTENAVSNGSPYIMIYLNDIFSDVLNVGTEELPIYLLSVLFIMSGFLLFMGFL